MFPHGVSHFIRAQRRIDGGWHIAIARHLQIFVGTTDMISDESKATYARLYDLLFHVHVGLRLPVRKDNLPEYQQTINDLLDVMVEVCAPQLPFKKKCNSIKFHWPRHWADTRRELGCSAAEKSLERKLGEIQKKNFSFTNSRYDVDVSNVHCAIHCDVHYVIHYSIHSHIHYAIHYAIHLHIHSDIHYTIHSLTFSLLLVHRTKWTRRQIEGGNCKICFTQWGKKALPNRTTPTKMVTGRKGE
jgi:hypothetical protein